MLKNYLLTALRSIRKSKISGAINIAGLTIGMASCLVIFLFVKKELDYDRFHDKSDRIFRFYTIDEALGVSSNEVAITEPMMSVAAKAEIPEVLNTARMLLQGRTRVEYGNEAFYSEDAKQYVRCSIQWDSQ